MELYPGISIMTSRTYHFKCTLCGRVLEKPFSTCPYCGGLVVIEYSEYYFRVDKSKPGIWRYSSLLPQFTEIVSYGEGLTPISSVDDVLVKNEKRNPTGSYSDRASTVIASYAKSTRIDPLVTRYVEVFTQSLLYYLRNVARVRVLLEDLYLVSIDDLVKFMSMSSVDIKTAGVNSDWGVVIDYMNPLTVEGLKTIIFELCEKRLNVENIVVPMETGVLAYSLAKGLEDLKKAGLDPGYMVVAAIIKGIQVPDIVTRSGIKVIEIEGDEVLSALSRLLKKGFVTKPISAVSYAVAENLKNSVAIITMGYKSYKVWVGRERLRSEIIKILKERGALTAYEIWKENPTYTLRAYYKALKSMEVKGELCSKVVMKGGRRVKYYKLCQSGFT